MNKEISKLENCLKTIKKCLKVPNVETCVCFSNAFKVFALEVKELDKRIAQFDIESQEKFIILKKEIEEVQKIISKENKECLGCNPCKASVVFKKYSNRLNTLYLNGEL